MGRGRGGDGWATGTSGDDAGSNKKSRGSASFVQCAHTGGGPRAKQKAHQARVASQGNEIQKMRETAGQGVYSNQLGGAGQPARSPRDATRRPRGWLGLVLGLSAFQVTLVAARRQPAPAQCSYLP
jgi:hypothetical protein